MAIMDASGTGLMMRDPPGTAGESVGKLRVKFPPVQEKRLRQTGSASIFGGLPATIEQILIYTVGLGLVFLYLVHCERENYTQPPVDSVLSSQGCPCNLREMISPSSALSWVVVFAPSLLTLPIARACQQCPNPHHKLDKTSTGADMGTYTDWTISAVEALQSWYNQSSGLWDTTGWWNSGNCLTVLGDFYALEPEEAVNLELLKVFSNTFTQAQQASSQGVRKIYVTTSKGLRIVESHYTGLGPGSKGSPAIVKRGFPGFINDYYDDEGWWALAWVRAYDVTGDASYLSMAESIFADMEGGVNGTCGGGIWWSKDRTYKNAIANELYLTVAASLANRVPYTDSYLTIAEGQWEWFYNSGMINSQNLINDGLTINADGTCTNNEDTTWTYNQGVILGGLVELYKANGNTSLLAEATTIAEAAIDNLSVDGILHESCEDDDCGADGSQFKGEQLRNTTIKTDTSSESVPVNPVAAGGLTCIHRYLYAQLTVSTARCQQGGLSKLHTE